MKFDSFLKVCHENGVLSKLSIYIVVAWILLQVMSVIAMPLGLPEKSVTLLIIFLLIGFPVYIFWVWKYFIVKSEQFVKDNNEPENKSIKNILKNPFHKIFFSLLTALSSTIIVLVILIVDNNFGNTLEIRKLNSDDKIGILKFGNNTGSKEFDIVGKMAADWIIHGITENNMAQVISPEIVNDYTSIITSTGSNNETVLETYFKPSRIISGNYYRSENKLIFQSTITDGELDKTFISLKPVTCDTSNPLGCIELLKQLILGYLITEDKKELNLQESPPIFEAYQYLLDAKELNSNSETYLELLNKAIEKDSTFFEPKVLRVAYYYNQGDFKKSDSLRQAIEAYTKTNKRQINLLNLYEDLIKGNNKLAFSHLKKEYDIAPFDMQTNASMMVIALQYINRPELVDEIFNEVSMQDIDLENCSNCRNRIYVKSLAYNELKKHSQVIELIEPIYEKNTNLSLLKKPLLSAYIRLDKDSAVSSFFSKEELISSPTEQASLFMHAGNEYLLKNNPKQATEYFGKVVQLYKEKNAETNLAKAYYFMGNYSESEKTFAKLLETSPDKIENLALLAISYEKNGKHDKADAVIKKLNQLRDKYQFGEVDYQLARYYATLGIKDKALEHLLKATADGQFFTLSTYQNDPHFLSIKNENEFIKIMNFWH